MTTPRDRLPPGRSLAAKEPVRTHGETPRIDPARRSLRSSGEVEVPRRWTWDELQRRPRVEVVADVHCVTRRSRLDDRWTHRRDGRKIGGGPDASGGDRTVGADTDRGDRRRSQERRNVDQKPHRPGRSGSARSWTAAAAYRSVPNVLALEVGIHLQDVLLTHPVRDHAHYRRRRRGVGRGRRRRGRPPQRGRRMLPCGPPRAAGAKRGCRTGSSSAARGRESPG